ncbi:hypothetical protein KUV23_06090 [Algoriphagus marincola]|uniref:Uncharacterized protein n=1 Tax=Algoriphagus marincola TaxID=264027 RepID=A0ABS7N2I4_9BACT|nr:hypothetical protein [Algoriphagus marincola]MBY5950534.1 hypothetical protein [Algoriphagus marincola]
MEKERKRHLLALGSYGCYFFTNFGKELDFDSFIIVNDVPPEDINVPCEYIYFPERKQFSCIIAGRKMPERLKELLRNLDGEIVCLAALGFGSGTGLYEAVGGFIRTLDKTEKFKFISIRSPEIEGGYPVKEANRVALRLTDLNQRSVSLDDLKIGYGYYSLEDYYQKGDEWVFEKLK